ncbi:MAG: pyridoxal phosphate-dependent aminotransferase [Acidobacteria bacterium]|jgi:aspartate aminotransferase|nr:pyridoxal phosphate-dependent aminotransferase [Acidobacteriota bacterium]
MNISKRGKEIQESPIRKLAGIANEAKARGIQIYHLNIGQPDVPTPDAFFKNIDKFSEKVLAYGPSDGLPELKAAMVDYFANFNISLKKENIVITVGGSEAVSFVFSVIADAGDEVIIPEPFYTNYNGYATTTGLKIVPIETKAETGFHLPDINEIEQKITGHTRAILICSPNNPTGTIFTEKEITELGRLAKKHDLFLVADEVYKEFTYDGEKHFSILELPGLEDRVIVIDSISKRYSACGARIGAVISRNSAVMQTILKFAQARLCPATLDQVGAIGAYRLPMDYFDAIKVEYQARRNILCDTLITHKDIVLQKPKGAFYIMAKLPIDDADNFARWMLQDFNENGETVMVAPGPGFYSTPGKGKQEVRMAYVLETHKLEKAAHILLNGLEKYNRR